MIGFSYPLIFTLLLLPLRAFCQTVQDDWLAPAAPDGSTLLQSGTKFTLLWKQTLQNNFELYCPSCDTTSLDLWITNFNGTKYQSKIGRGLDLTAITSYDWDVQIASSAFSEKSFWVFRFTFFDSTDPYTQQISSPGFRINGLVKVVSTSSVQSSTSTSTSTSISTSTSVSTSVSTSITPTVITSSNIAFTSTDTATSSSETPESTEQVSATASPRSNFWIAGVVVGPLVGIGLGAAFMWFCLRRRKRRALQGQKDTVQQHPAGRAPVEKDSHTIEMEAQPRNRYAGHEDQHPVEAPGNTIPAEPAELWHGNYRS